jgi:beta-glucanase (GH16 family)
MQRYKNLGYHTYTSAAMETIARARYGYFEVCARPMRSAGSSSFWFASMDPKDRDKAVNTGQEIDVFEIGGKAIGFEHKYNMNAHATRRTANNVERWNTGGVWLSPWKLADDFHVYGLEWDEHWLQYYVDGVLVRKVENTCWHYPLRLIFDSETMPTWFGMPEDKDLPSTFSVKYVRAWQKK